jgi:hypothetical protein
VSTIVYAVVFKGEVLEGFQTFSVKAHLANLLKADQQKMAALFSGKQVVLKRTEDKQQALRLGSALKKIGANIQIRAIKSETAPAAAKSGVAQVASTAGAQLSLAPNVGNLVDPKPAAPPPDIDLSGLSASEIGDTTLQAPREELALDLDLSEYSIAEPGEGFLVAPKPEAPRVEAPDFGLDEPGAVLETLKPEVEEVHPDISTLSLAAPGGDLLDPSERPAPPKPVVPDISQIDLAPLPER